MSEKPKVVITHWVHAEVIERLSSSCTVIANQTDETLPRQEILARAKEAQGLMVFLTSSRAKSAGFLNITI